MHSVHSTWCPALLPPSQAVPLGDGDTFHNSLASFGEQLLLLTSHGEQICFLSVLWHQGMEKVFLVPQCYLSKRLLLVSLSGWAEGLMSCSALGQWLSH